MDFFLSAERDTQKPFVALPLVFSSLLREAAEGGGAAAALDMGWTDGGLRRDALVGRVLGRSCLSQSGSRQIWK